MITIVCKNIKYLPKEKVLRDPIHNYIYIQHQVILDLINTRSSKGYAGLNN